MAADKTCSYFTDDEVCALKVPALKNYLRQHGQYVTGNKSDLIERAKGIRKLQLRDVNDVKYDDATVHSMRNKEKLTTPLGEVIPEPSLLKNWTVDVTNIPHFSDSEIYNYLVLTMKAKRQFRSKVYFEDRHVHSLEYHPVSDECSHCLVRCKVIPSLPSSNKKDNPDHDVWVCLSKVSGKVHSANCNCTAGTGEACNHISALLYALEDVTSKMKDGTLSSTSQKCKWNNPRKRKLSPKKVQDLNFNKFHINNKKVDSDTATNCEKKNSASAVKPTINIERLKQKLLSANSSAAWLTFYVKENTTHVEEQQYSVPKLHDVRYMYRDSVDLTNMTYQKHFHKLFNDMTVTEENVAKIEKLTNGQSKNDQWFKARSERITSSNFGSVCKMRSDTKPDYILKTILGYREFSSKFCDWGHKHEPAARRMYANSLKEEQGQVMTCGLLVNPKYPHLGASPDGLVRMVNGTVQHDKLGTLEIKCPASEKWKYKHPKDCAEDSDFFCFKDESDSVKLKRCHNYFFQVQGQMLISERKWCDFVVWTLKGWTVESIHFDEEFCKSMVTKLDLFYMQNIIPEIFSERVKRGHALYP